jgi:hypothetical protein
MTGSLMPLSESQRRLWSLHNSAAVPARAAGACVLCAAEAGCRATDRPGDEREPRLMHPECARRIARANRG